MRRIASVLASQSFVANVRAEAVQHDVLRPALIVTPNWSEVPGASMHSESASSSSSSSAAAAGPGGDGVAAGLPAQLDGLRVRVMVGYSAQAMPDQLLEPGINNHTRRGHFGRAQVATPRYNFRVRQDSEHVAVLRALHGALSGHRGALEALVILKDWARRRGLGRSSDGISSPLLAAIVAFLT